MRPNNRLKAFLPTVRPPASRAKRSTWPEHYDPELDGVVCLTADMPYRVLSKAGRCLGEFTRRTDAITALHSWQEAEVIVLGSYVIKTRKESL